MTEKFVICLDPESYQIFSFGLTTQLLVLELDVPIDVRQKSMQTIRDIKNLLDCKSTIWSIQSKESWAFRKRMLPKYLVRQDTNPYPRILQMTELSSAFSEATNLELVVDLNQYSHIKSEGTIKVNCPQQIQVVVPLATGADEVIKKCIRLVYRDYKIKLSPATSDKRLALKANGYHEFFYGDIPLMNYDRVRANLRGLKNFTVILTDITLDHLDQGFPPIVERNIAEVLINQFEAVPWEKFKNHPMVVWYPPIDLPPYKPKMAPEGVYSKYIHYRKEFVDALEYPRAFIHYGNEEFISMRKNNINKKISTFKSARIYSGEIDFPFKIKLMGIENLQRIFEQANKGATNNGNVTPTYITKNESLDNIHQDKKDKKVALNEKLPPKLAKSKVNNQPTQIFHVDQGIGSSNFIQFSKSYEYMPFAPYCISVEARIYHGNRLLKEFPVVESKYKPFNFSPRWCEWLSFEKLKISDMPMESRISFKIVAHSQNGDRKIIGCTYFHLFDIQGRLKKGLNEINVWPFYTEEPQAICAEGFWGLLDQDENIEKLDGERRSFLSSNWCRLLIQLDDFAEPVYWSLKDIEILKTTGEYGEKEEIKEEVEVTGMFSIKKKIKKKSRKTIVANPVKSSHNADILEDTPKIEDLACLQGLLQRDPLNQNFNQAEKDILIKCRHHFKTLPKGLPIFLLAIDWSNPTFMREAHSMLKEWEPLEPSEAIVLLDARYGDEAVRAYAVERISKMTDDELSLYLLELTMALIYEPSHFSFLGEFLLERALSNHQMIGHEFYWLLKSQLHVKVNFERYFLLLEQYLMLTGSYRKELLDQIFVNDNMQKIAEIIAGLGEKTDKKMLKGECKTRIAELNKILPQEVSFSLDSRMRISGFIPEECKVMDSKKQPLWLGGKNTQQKGDKILIMFKVGDDLRQDLLTLQLIRIVDKIWLDNGLDLRMKPYRVISTADQVGMIEVVVNSSTISDIQKEFGGAALGAFRDTTLKDYIEKYSSDPNSKARAIDNFIRSSAGYCILTYILGIGDRHTGNIMITRAGHFFHIDFGHFLGNFKSKFGFKRERTPFVLTPEMVNVMGGKESDDFAKFVEFCVRGYNLVRKNGHFLINLFILMLSAGMPELFELSHINYLQKMLSLELNEQEAAKKFKEEINSCLGSSTIRRIDNMFHNLKRE